MNVAAICGDNRRDAFHIIRAATETIDPPNQGSNDDDNNDGTADAGDNNEDP